MSHHSEKSKQKEQERAQALSALIDDIGVDHLIKVFTENLICFAISDFPTDLGFDKEALSHDNFEVLNELKKL